MIALLLDMVARLRVTAGGIVDSFEMPLTQADIGDATGLTKVHVNRTLREMERRGMIARASKRVRLIDEPAMIAATGFVDRYAVVATDWLPPRHYGSGLKDRRVRVGRCIQLPNSP